MYTCGPTVYSHAHIGNFRAYLFEDLLQRHLELRGYTVRARDEHHRRRRQDDPGLEERRMFRCAEFTAPFKQAFFEDLDTLRIKRADSFPAATDPSADRQAMIEMIEKLMARELAYQAEDKSVYFRINEFPGIRQLAHFDLVELRSTGRVKSDEYDKEHVGDFALWKAWDEEDGRCPLGESVGTWPARLAHRVQRDGDGSSWASSSTFIAAAWTTSSRITKRRSRRPKAAPGRQFVRYWLHCAHLMVDGQKMSKSLGNFYTLRDVLAKGYSGREVRYALMRVHYRAPLNFTWEGMEEARQALRSDR